jgi:ABC-2 type transport system ATP-binding protein
LIIELDNINVRFGQQKILDNVSIRFGGGSAGLLGPNGAGKTTLLKTLLGFITPVSGGGRVLGHDIRKDQLTIRQKIGYMPENDCHIPGMNAVSYVSYAGQLAGMKPKDSLQRAHETLYYVGLGEARYRNLETYSTGMKQRIKLAQALVHDPELIFLDEPTNGLDPRGRIEMLDLIRDISSSKQINVLLSSHLLPDVEWVCSEAMVINKGRMLASGRIEDLKRGAGAAFELRLKGDGGSFLDRLRTLGCRCTANDDGLLRVQMSDGMNSRSILTAARECGVQIRHLVPLKQSLEDVFLQVIGESDADS